MCECLCAVCRYVLSKYLNTVVSFVCSKCQMPILPSLSSTTRATLCGDWLLLCMAAVVEECCSRVWCQASGARVVGGRLVCSGLIASRKSEVASTPGRFPQLLVGNQML